MAATGGAALVVGIWYQLLGAAATLIGEGLECDEVGPNCAQLEATRKVRGERSRIVVEYFDMDAVRLDQEKIELYQFKVSTQLDLPGFNKEEVRKILENATQAILKHERENKPEKIVSFVLASNRQIGQCLADLRQAVKDNPVELDNPELLAEFGEVKTPASLFGNGKRKMRDYALSITQRQASRWDATKEESVNACLKAMAGFRFAQARSYKLRQEIERWLQTWGILESELESFTGSMLGVLFDATRTSKPLDKISIMEQVLNSKGARPIAPCEIWLDVVEGIWNQSQDLPTRDLIGPNGPAKWLLGRPTLLRGLPKRYEEDLNVGTYSGETYFVNIKIPPRIFALVGPGGTGKTTLMRWLFAEIAGEMWDWEAETFQSNLNFYGYPILAAAAKSPLENVDGALERWGRRTNFVEPAIKRFVAACGGEGEEPVIWLGLDGVDEMRDASLLEFAKEVANLTNNNRNLRIVLTCRDSQFQHMVQYLSHYGLMRHIEINEFDSEEAQTAVKSATNNELKLGPTPAHPTARGPRRDAPRVVSSSNSENFFKSLQQPLFIGVVQYFYRKYGIDEIQKAYEGDQEARKRIATEYIHIFCERMKNRLGNVYIDKWEIFRALKQLAKEVESPQSATLPHWNRVCRPPLEGHQLYRQCIASGLISETDGEWGAFEWRHPDVGEYLPTMEKPHGNN